MPNFDWSSIAASTEGFLASDLYTVLQRAMNEMLLRCNAGDSVFIPEDFERAREGFVPSSLQNLKTQTKSQVLWKDIGGLEGIKEMLIQTIEWPTKYADIFSYCSLRLRSGYVLFSYISLSPLLIDIKYSFVRISWLW